MGSGHELISVKAEAGTAEFTEGVISTTIDNTKVVELPLNGRNFNNLAARPARRRGDAAERERPGPNRRAKRQLELHARWCLQQRRVLQDELSLPPSTRSRIQDSDQQVVLVRAAGANINVSIKSGNGTSTTWLRTRQAGLAQLLRRSTWLAFKFNQFGLQVHNYISEIYNGKCTFFFFNYEGFQQAPAADHLEW